MSKNNIKKILGLLIDKPIDDINKLAVERDMVEYLNNLIEFQPM
jgi:hypothetical protein